MFLQIINSPSLMGAWLFFNNLQVSDVLMVTSTFTIINRVVDELTDF